MSRLVQWPARRAGALGGNGSNRGGGWSRARLRVAIHISIVALAVATPIGAPAEEGPPVPHVRVKGLPAGVTLSGGQMTAERIWIVPLRRRGALKIEIPGGLHGNLDLNVALVGDNGDALAERGVTLRVKPEVAATPSSEAAAAQRSEAVDKPPVGRPPGATSEVEPSAATTPSVGFTSRQNDASLGPHFQIKGLPADVRLSGGRTNGERPWAMPLSDGKQAWMVPLWALDDLKIEIPPGLAGNLDFVVALADNTGGVLAERAVALRVKPAVVAAQSGREPDAGQRKDAVVATPALPPKGAAPAAPSAPEPDAAQRKDASVATPALPLSGAVSTALSQPEPDAVQREDVAIATPALPPSGAAPAAQNGRKPDGGERKDAAIATPALPPDAAVSAAPSQPEPDAVKREDAAIATPALPPDAAVSTAPSQPEPDAVQREDVAIATPALPPDAAVSAAPSQLAPDVGQRKDVAIATTALPPSGAASAARNGRKPDAGEREDAAIATPALPPDAAPSQPAPDVGQGKDAAVTTPALPPSGTAPAASERECALVECRARAEELEQAERLIRYGDRYLAQGNIAIARQYFARAADLGLAIAALKIAETYDPNELARRNVHGVKPNLAEARRWYQRAFELDVPEAQARVQRLSTQ